MLPAVHGSFYRLGIGRSMGTMQQIVLTTTGRTTGKSHTVVVGALSEGDGWVVIGSFYGFAVHPHWWLNLLAHPDATVRVNDRTFAVRMEEITNPADRERLWNRAVSSQPAYARYAAKTSRLVPLGLLRPIASAAR